jgi:2-amino-4-hydroxy-6-hydroxymethyldihydropteridine diphosphokinase
MRLPLPQVHENNGMTILAIGLGSNLPGQFGAAPHATIEAAIAALAGLPRLVLRARSRLWDSAAWPDPGAPRYVNAVALLHGEADPAWLLAQLHALEAAEGRVRGTANAPRPLDLDLLAVGDIVRTAPDPLLPHPRLHQRAFVLGPLAEICPNWRHPVLGATAAALLAGLPPADCHPIDPR